MNIITIGNPIKVDFEEIYQYYDMSMKVIALQNSILKGIQDHVENHLCEMDEDMGVFHFNKDALEEFMENAGTSDTIRITLESDKNYKIAAEIIDNGELRLGIFKEEDGVLYMFNHRTSEWNEQKEIGWIRKIVSQSNAKSDLLMYLSNCFTDLIQGFSENDFQNFCQKNRPILDLYWQLNGLMAFQLIPKRAGFYSEKIQDIHTCYLALVPDDPERYGAAVYYENGYHICQFLDNLDLEDAFEDSYYPEVEVLEDTRLLKTVIVENSVGKVKQMLRVYLDHYNPGGHWYIFPLSPTAYVSARKPFRNLPVYTSPWKRELNGKEQEDMEFLKSFMNKTRKKCL